MMWLCYGAGALVSVTCLVRVILSVKQLTHPTTTSICTGDERRIEGVHVSKTARIEPLKLAATAGCENVEPANPEIQS